MIAARNSIMIIAIFLQLFICQRCFSQTSSQNYVRESVLLDKFNSDPCLDFDFSRNTITYFDGLGRPVQTVKHAAGYSVLDIHTITEYDSIGNPYKEWQPMKGLYSYYNNARFRDAIFAGTFYQQDPLSEKYYPFSPYHYGACNPGKFSDVNGATINVTSLQLLDKANNSNIVDNLIVDFNEQTGLILSVDKNGNLQYLKDINSFPVISLITDSGGNIIEGGSNIARSFLIGIIDNKEEVTVAPGLRSSAIYGTNIIGINASQIESFINGSVGISNKTLGYGMTLLYELFHTQVGGALLDKPGKIGPVVTQMNAIRKELNDKGYKYGIRNSYKASQILNYCYLPFSEAAMQLIELGIIPINYYIKF